MQIAAIRGPAFSRGSVRLAKAMKDRGLNQSDVAEAIGVGRHVVCRWLSGQRRASLSYAVRIEREYGVPVDSWSKDLRSPRRQSRPPNAA